VRWRRAKAAPDSKRRLHALKAMRILITRPQEDAARIAELLRAHGHEPICSSLLTVRFFDGPELTFESVSAILATSANGMRAFARRTGRRDLKILAVGPQTADAAKKAGFEDVECADGDAAMLADAMLGWVKPEEGVLLHAASADNEGQLKTLLAEEGYTVDVIVLYEVVALHKLPTPAREALVNDAIDAVVVFSPRSAMALRECIQRTGLEKSCERLAAVCISQATADGLQPLCFRQVVIAQHPNQDGMLEGVECAAMQTMG
jgi:uroporphyrinogen-III synthase